MEDTLRHKGVRHGQVKINNINKSGFYGVALKELNVNPAESKFEYAAPPSVPEGVKLQ